jgi:CubicO group peptidase (beta-lactamase class C family)
MARSAWASSVSVLARRVRAVPAAVLACHVRAFPAAEVESRNTAAEVDPREVDLGRADVDAIWAAVVRLYETRLHPAIALTVRRRGRVVLDRALGHLAGNAPDDPPDAPRVPARHDSLFGLFSASKAITAMLVHIADERGWLRLDDPVARYLPEFRGHGKERITLRHLLAHRAGLAAVDAPAELLTDPPSILAHLAAARPVSAPGGRLAYHAVTSGFLLGAVLERVAGRDLRTLLRDEITGPLGLATLDYGVPAERIGAVARNAFTGLPPFPPMSTMFERTVGVGVRAAVALSNSAAFLTGVVPSANVVSTADDACRFFQALLDGGGGVVAPATIARAVEPHTSYLELDGSLGLPIRYGLGFMLGADHLSLYGPRTRRAFGHLGLSNVVAWADPDRALSACLMTSGKPFITPGQVAWLQVARTIARRCSRVETCSTPI